MDVNELFWSVDVGELMKGYTYLNNEEKYFCLICGKAFEKGLIYQIESLFCEAEKAVQVHIEKEHGSVFEYLLSMNKKNTGLTEIQVELLSYFYDGFSDKEIVENQGGGSTSTIRNHRFKLKEKERQAKVFLALMGLLEKRENSNNKLVSIHKGATMVDDRYNITEDERTKIVKTYFKNDRLTNLPSKEKRKIIILGEIAKKFDMHEKYTEKEVNEIIKALYEDYVTVRRYLIEYGFMERNQDGSQYWIKK